MKILQLCTKVPFPPKDGGAAVVYAFSQALATMGHSIDILAVNSPKHFISPNDRYGIPQNIHIHSVEFDTRPLCLEALKNLLCSELPYQVERFINKNLTEKLTELLSDIQPDIVQIEGTYLCPYLPVIREHSNATVILRAHNIEFNLWQNIACNTGNLLKKWYLKIQSQRLKRYELAQYTLTDAVTTVTENDRTVIRGYTPDVRTITAPFGVKPVSSPINTEIDTKSIFFLGALDWMPNQEAIEWFVNETWPLLHHQFPDIHFHIAGRNAPAPLVRLLNNTKGVVYHGEIPDARSFINQFSIMVSPLFSGSGIRVKIIEAMQYGKVVIASTKAIEGIPAIPGKHLLRANSPQEFAGQLEWILSNHEEALQISANAIEFINENFNILAIASNLIEFYNKVHND